MFIRVLAIITFLFCYQTSGFSAPQPQLAYYLQNNFVEVGINPSAGGAISFLAPKGSVHTLVNTYDLGRYIQQSFYGGPDGSTWNGKPWSWNPVQAGSATGQPSKLLDFKNYGRFLYAKTLPKHWATGADIPDLIMEEWISLDNQIVRVHYRMHYTGRIVHPPADQEMPAAFLDHRLETLTYYKGPAPWTAAPLTRIKPAPINQYDDIPENWAAYLNENNWGVGVYTPGVSRLTFYFVGDKKSGSAYLAPIKTLPITPGMTLDYDVYLRVGSITEIRNSFYKIHSQLQRGPMRPFPPR
ncbi:hypothetical protein [Pedosphaera parvula]|uniref:DUF4380 domain-containing protein n=1 Tax=Pedosphaera parvula (strain Ellin514) TaxID=320771 RepID=B9XMZ7_PEDPL|nr:hypothetical protein [Pedosphaera parvula]EEF58793.1 hypothetical protein Cflav_PD1966 [Pedosphaera parvula Ellin514]